MDSGISPINITVAAVITQLSLIVIMVVGAVILKGKATRVSRPWRKDIPASSLFPWLIVFLSIFTIGPLSFSDDLVPLLQPMLGDVQIPSMGAPTTRLWMFILDIIFVTVMVYYTGGSRDSAFSPIYFILPALAIFLRESFGRLSVYLILITVCFSYGLLYRRKEFGSYEKDSPEYRIETFAYWVVAIACLVLTTFVAYVTRPR